MKVIFHIDEMEKWDLTIKNVKNFIREEDGADLIILANSLAVKGYLRESEIEQELSSFLGSNIRMKACGNALKELKLEEKELINSVEVVPAGVVELAKKQAEGYAYIRP